MRHTARHWDLSFFLESSYKIHQNSKLAKYIFRINDFVAIHPTVRYESLDIQEQEYELLAYTFYNTILYINYMVLYLKLDQNVWAQRDFTDSALYDLTGTVYDDNTLTTARDISAFTGTLRLIDQNGELIFSTQQNLTLNSDGTFLVKFGQGLSPVVQGTYKIRLRLEVSGTRLTCVGVNGSDEIYFEYD